MLILLVDSRYHDYCLQTASIAPCTPKELVFDFLTSKMYWYLGHGCNVAFWASTLANAVKFAAYRTLFVTYQVVTFQVFDILVQIPYDRLLSFVHGRWCECVRVFLLCVALLRLSIIIIVIIISVLLVATNLLPCLLYPFTHLPTDWLNYLPPIYLSPNWGKNHLSYHLSSTSLLLITYQLSHVNSESYCVLCCYCEQLLRPQLFHRVTF